MSNSFRIDASELSAWHATLAARMDVRGVPAIAKEIEAHLARKEADGTVVVTRHQLFTWAEALQGVASRDRSNALVPIVAQMRSILSGQPVSATQRDVSVASLGPRGGPALGPAPGQVISTSEPVRSMYAPPPVVYSRTAGATAGTVLTGAPLADAVRETIRAATRELYVSSPWVTGVETLVGDLVALPPAIRLLILSRRPDRDDGAFHQAMDQLGRRRAVTAWSPYVQTRMIVADDTRAIVGAASAPGANSREIGIVVTDPATISALRAAFERAHEEAAGGKY